jgi:AcrR family transcriptional regulator
MARKNARERMLRAAQAVVVDVGAAHMTLDQVSAAAGVSKGGLLYHFPTKEALIQALIESYIAGFQAALSRERARQRDGPLREIRAHIAAGAKRDAGTKQLGAALLLASAHDPKLLAPARREFRRIFRQYDAAGGNSERAAEIALACDGLRMLELLGLMPYNGRRRAAMIRHMLRLVGACEEDSRKQSPRDGRKMER